MKRALGLVVWLCAACATVAPVTKQSDVAVAPTARVLRASAPWVASAPPDSLPAVDAVEPKVTHLVLPNGLKLIVVEHHRRPLVKLRLVLPGGAAGDSDEQAGLTYYAVSLLGDTADRKDRTGSSRDPDEKSARWQVVEAGGALSIEVTHDTSWIEIDGFAVDTREHLKKLANVVLTRRHGEPSFVARASTVADALDELEVSDPVVLDQYLTELAFGEGHPYSRAIYGNPSSLRNIGVEDVGDMQKKLLVPKGSTLIVVGDVTPQEVRRMADEALRKWVTPGQANWPEIERPAIRARSAVTFVPRKPSLTTLLCAARPTSDVVASEATLELLAAVVGERLSGVLREQRGLTYQVASAVVRRRAARSLMMCSRIHAPDTTVGFSLFMKTLADAARSPPTEAELEHWRSVLITRARASTDDLEGAMAVWTGAVTYGVEPSAAQRVAALRKVTVKDLAKVAARVLRTESMQLVAAGEARWVTAAVKKNRLGALRRASVTVSEERQIENETTDQPDGSADDGAAEKSDDEKP